MMKKDFHSLIKAIELTFEEETPPKDKPKPAETKGKEKESMTERSNPHFNDVQTHPVQ